MSARPQAICTPRRRLNLSLTEHHAHPSATNLRSWFSQSPTVRYNSTCVRALSGRSRYSPWYHAGGCGYTRWSTYTSYPAAFASSSARKCLPFLAIVLSLSWWNRPDSNGGAAGFRVRSCPTDDAFPVPVHHVLSLRCYPANPHIRVCYITYEFLYQNPKPDMHDSHTKDGKEKLPESGVLIL